MLLVKITGPACHKLAAPISLVDTVVRQIQMQANSPRTREVSGGNMCGSFSPFLARWLAMLQLDSLDPVARRLLRGDACTLSKTVPAQLRGAKPGTERSRVRKERMGGMGRGSLRN